MKIINILHYEIKYEIISSKLYRFSIMKLKTYLYLYKLIIIMTSKNIYLYYIYIIDLDIIKIL